jgi:hypothetical protein
MFKLTTECIPNPYAVFTMQQVTQSNGHVKDPAIAPSVFHTTLPNNANIVSICQRCTQSVQLNLSIWRHSIEEVCSLFQHH